MARHFGKWKAHQFQYAQLLTLKGLVCNTHSWQPSTWAIGFRVPKPYPLSFFVHQTSHTNLGSFHYMGTSHNMFGCSLQGVLTQVKNDDKLSCEEKFHATNWKAQACTRALLFFLLSFGGWGGWGDFFPIFPWFPMCSFKFPMGSQYVPQHILHSTSLLSPMFWNYRPPFTYIDGPKGRNSILQNKTFYFEEPL